MSFQVTNTLARRQYHHFTHKSEMESPRTWRVWTIYMWSSYTGEPYLSYTVHFLDNEWKLKSHCLQALYLPEDHTADNIADAPT